MIIIDTTGSVVGIFCLCVLLVVYNMDRKSNVAPGFKFYRHTDKDIGRGSAQGAFMGLCLSSLHVVWIFLCQQAWLRDRNCTSNEWQTLSTIFLAIYYSLSIHLRFYLVNSCNDVQLGEHYYIGVALGLLATTAPFLGVGFASIVVIIFFLLILPFWIIVPYITTIPMIGPCWIMCTALGSNIAYLLLEEKLFGHWTR